MARRPPAEQDADRLRALGHIVRASRRGLLSLEALAQQAEVSVGQLSRIENGTANPSVEVLLRIGDALGIELSDLIEPPSAAATQVVKAEQRRRYRSPVSPAEVELITSRMHHEISVTYCVAEPGEVRVAEQAVRGDALYFVLAGEITVNKGGKAFPLRSGDALLVSFPHRITATGDESARHLVVFRPAGD